MKSEKFNRPDYKLRVLVAPLDWGLGHATRSIPVINALLQQNCDVIIATEGACKALLQKELPGILFLDLKGYRVQYSRKKWWMPLKLLMQFPKIIRRVYAEHSWLKKIVILHSIDAVISDSRMGMYHSSVPCVYIVHQLKIKTGSRFTEWFVQKIHYYFINKYSECWVPDAADEINLAGELSHPAVLPKVPVKYIGPLSRLENIVTEKKYDLLIILSGPEPQRTIFEKILLNDLKNFKGMVLLVRGLPENIETLKSPSTEIHNHLPALEMNQAILQSEIIISRGGYTTVMDLIKLQKKAILVPTPGQTEQEYLAGHLMKQKIFFCISQNNFSLSGALKKAENFPFSKTTFPQNDYEKVIKNFLQHFL